MNIFAKFIANELISLMSKFWLFPKKFCNQTHQPAASEGTALQTTGPTTLLAHSQPDQGLALPASAVVAQPQKKATLIHTGNNFGAPGSDDPGGLHYWTP